MNEASVGHQCPECVAEGRRTQRSARTAFGGTAAGRAGTVTRTLIGINVAAMILWVIAGGMGAIAGGGWGGLLGSSTPLTQFGAVLGLSPYVIGGELHGIAAGEWWRLLTAMFLHYGILHLLLNMWGLWILGRELEAVLGRIRFVALYVLAGLGGNVAAYLFAPAYQQTVGASTAVFGLMAATFVVLKRLNMSVAPIAPLIVINVIFTFTASGISVAGHLGGLVVGALAAGVLAYAPRASRTMWQSVGCGIILAVLLAASVVRTLSLTG